MIKTLARQVRGFRLVSVLTPLCMIGEGKVLRFKILDVPFTNIEDAISVSLRWNSKDSTFSVGVSVEGVDITEDADLTNGYEIKYYTSENAPDAVTSFTYGNRYYYRIKGKVPNHTLWYVNGWVSAK